MTKKQLIEKIKENVTVTNVELNKVYGVSNGVGYDLTIEINNNQYLKAHALRQSWACIGHLRPNQVEFKKYTGSNDIYRENVKAYWLDADQEALEEYFMRMRKSTLQNFVDTMC